MEDEHGLFEVVLFPPVFRRCRAYIGTLGPYEVVGRVESRYDVTAITAESVRPYTGGVSKGERERRREGKKPLVDLSEVYPGSG
jgi:hypothetical protein